MFARTKVPTEGKTSTVPVKATATGKIDMWYFEENPTLGGRPLRIEEGRDLCAIGVKTNGFQLEFVEAPVTGFLVKIIKGVDEWVKEGEVIAEMKPLVPVVPPKIPIHKVPPELREEFFDSIG